MFDWTACRTPGQYDDSNGMYSFGFPCSVSYPTTQIFTERIKKELEGVPNVEIFVRDEGLCSLLDLLTSWRISSLGSRKKHGALSLLLWCAFDPDLRCRIRSCQSHMEHQSLQRSLKCRFKCWLWIARLIIHSHYKGAADKSAPPVAFVGKGITFDSGGISLKPGNVGWPLIKVQLRHVECVLLRVWNWCEATWVCLILFRRTDNSLHSRWRCRCCLGCYCNCQVETQVSLWPSTNCPNSLKKVPVSIWSLSHHWLRTCRGPAPLNLEICKHLDLVTGDDVLPCRIPVSTPWTASLSKSTTLTPRVGLSLLVCLYLSNLSSFADWGPLADAIYYTATEYRPHTLIDVATLTG